MNDHVGRLRSNETGRTQLKGVLDGLVQQSKEERELHESVGAIDDDVEEGARDLLELPHLRGELNRKRGRNKSPPSAKRKKLRRIYKDIIPSSEGSESGGDMDGDRHIPYVMTLFDRKVDLARFTGGTSLYVMCREWMKNNPDADGEVMGNGAHDNRFLRHLEHEQLDFGVYKLPSPIRLSGQELGQTLRLAPSTSSNSTPLALGLEEDIQDIQVLRETNVKRWKETRARWKQASLVNQQRYSASLKIIRELYER